MIIKTRSFGLIWVEWPPVEDAEVWCRGFDPDGGRAAAIYRLVDGAWVLGEWEDTGAEERDRGVLH